MTEAQKFLYFFLPVLVLIVCVALYHIFLKGWLEERRMIKLASDITAMRSTLVRRRLEEELKRRKDLNRRVIVAAKKLQAEGTYSSAEDDLIAWFKERNYEILPPGKFETYTTIKIPKVTDKELADIIIGVKK